MFQSKLVLSVVFMAAGFVAAQNSTSNETTECADGLKMFVARGTGEEPGVGETGKLVDLIAEQIEGSDIEAIVYPAQFVEVNYFLSVSNGTEAIREKISSYAEACPGHKMAFFGYSQGAQITSNNFCGQPYVWATAGGSLDAEATPKNLTEEVLAIVLLGDPTHHENSSYDRGTAKGSGVFHRSPGGNGCEDLGTRVRSYCDTGDVFCDVGSKPDAKVHLSYLSTYGEEIIEFVVERFNNGDEGSDDGDSPSASSTPTPDQPGVASGKMPMMAAAVFAALSAFVLV